MKTIWIIAPFTDIEKLDYRNRFQYIAKQLVDEGFEVHLFTSDYIHLEWKYRSESIKKEYPFKLHFIHETGYTSTISPKRAISHINFARNLVKKINIMKKPDLIYCAYPMMTAAYFTGKFAKKNNIPFILDIQDTWPESISAGINTDNIIVKMCMFPFTIFANMIYRMADVIVGVSETYVNRGKVKGGKAKDFISVYIGAEGNKFDVENIQKIEKKDGEIWVTYIGTLSHSYDIETAIKAFKLLEEGNYKNIKLYILGTGPEREELEEKAKAMEILSKNVFFTGLLDYNKMISYLKNSDIALNAIRGKALQTITNKFGDYVSAGLPLLNSCQAKEVLNLVIDKKLGLNYLPGNPKSLKNTIVEILKDKDKLKEYSKNCKKFAKEKFDRRKSYNIIFEKIKELMGE